MGSVSDALRPQRVALIGTIAALTLWSLISSGINQDARFVLGALGAGWSPNGAWTHRPLLFRLMMAPFADLDPAPFDETVIRFLILLSVVAAVAALHWGLQGLTPRRWFVSGAVGASLTWAPGWDFAEPEWMATVLCVTAAGLALRYTLPQKPDPLPIRQLCAAAAATLIAVAALMKFTTSVIVVVVLALVWLSRGRYEAVMLAWRGVTIGGLLFVVTILVSGPEYLWLTEMSALNPPLGPGTPRDLIEGFANMPMVAPITVVAVAAVGSIWRRRRRAAISIVVCIAVLCVPFVMQHQNFLYHLAPVPVCCSAVVAYVVCDEKTPDAVRSRLGLTGVAATLAALALWAFPENLRDAHWELAAAAMVAVIPAVWIVHRWWPTNLTPVRWLALAAMAPLLVPLAPHTAYSYSLAHRDTTNLDNRSFAQPLELPGVPHDVPVLYLSFSAPYRMSNPSTCQYVSPTWLQRAGDRPGVQDTRSFERNMACLYDSSARFAIIETEWFRLADAPPRIRTAIENEFDCLHAERTVDGFIACPRK